MLGAIATHRVNNVFCVPTVWRRLLSSLDKEAHDVSSVRRCLGSSDTLPPDLLDGILERFQADVFVTYGLTEAGCILTYSRLTREDRTEIDTVGRPHPLVEVAVDALPGEVGEVLARGPTLMDGYWELEAQTAEALAGGWLHTGDLGRFDQRGALHLAGRAKDMIVSGGEKVYPLEVERLIRTLPGVADVALIGVPDPEWGESLLACVVPAPGPEGEALSEAAIKAFVRPRLAGYKCPRYVELVASLPVTSATNKVQKGALRERFRDLGEARRGRNESGKSG
jgi:acyl-CoA synthetase (AMP-forming)/AMP-acid ligase II